MGILSVFRRLFGKRYTSTAVEVIGKKEQAFSKPIEALSQAQQALVNRECLEDLKEPFQLGLAAGYTGRSIKEIESSLHRIESQIATKDWFLSTFEDKTPELISLLRSHEEEEKKRFEAITNLLASLQKVSEKAPQPIKTELIPSTSIMERQFPLTPKMEGLILTVKEFGEISYQDLALKLGISVSGLRGLLTNTLRRTDKIERFIKNNKGWVRYKGD